MEIGKDLELRSVLFFNQLFRSAIEMLEAELRDSSSNLNLSSVEMTFFEKQTDPHAGVMKKQEIDIVSAT